MIQESQKNMEEKNECKNSCYHEKNKNSFCLSKNICPITSIHFGENEP